MTADEDGLEALLRARYLAELKAALEAFAGAVGFADIPDDRGPHRIWPPYDAVVRLFVRYDSFPAFSAWRTDVLRAELAETQRPEPSLPSTPSQAEPRLRAVQILGGERTTDPEWQRLLAWGKANGRRLYEGTGRNRKWNLTEAELEEALR